MAKCTINILLESRRRAGFVAMTGSHYDNTISFEAILAPLERANIFQIVGLFLSIVR
jgi:hypothetical protein